MTVLFLRVLSELRTDGPHAGNRHVRLRGNSGFFRRTDGLTFSPVKTFMNGDDDNVYHRYESSLTSVSSTFVIEFEMSGSRDYACFDDIEIRGGR